MRRAAVTAVAVAFLVSAVFLGVRTLHGSGAVAQDRAAVDGPTHPGASSAEPSGPPVTNADGLPRGTPRGTVSPERAAPRATAVPSATAGISFTLALGANCVVPGGTQSLTAYSRPGYSVSFNSQYADGKFGNSYGGYGVLATDARGVARATWTVAATAPIGTVTVAAGTANGGPATVVRETFTLAAHC